MGEGKIGEGRGGWLLRGEGGEGIEVRGGGGGGGGVNSLHLNQIHRLSLCTGGSCKA